MLSTAQTLLTGYDVSLQRHIRHEERAWRAEDLDFREHERVVLVHEQAFMQEERAFLAVQVQQAHVDNARALWLRFVNRNRVEVQEKTEQLKALSGLAALLAGFALMSFLNFQFNVAAHYNRALLPLFALTTSITVGVEVAALVLCSLMLANILRIGKTYVSEQEEAEFMHRCQVFVSAYRPGSRPPAPPRTFAVYWSHRCEREWGTAFRLFSTGILCFFINLALAGWIKFHDASTPTSASLVTVCMGIALVWNLYAHRKWGHYLLQDGDPGQEAGHRSSQPAVGLPFDWHLSAMASGSLQPQHLHTRMHSQPPSFGDGPGPGHADLPSSLEPMAELYGDQVHALDVGRATSGGAEDGWGTALPAVHGSAGVLQVAMATRSMHATTPPVAHEPELHPAL